MVDNRTSNRKHLIGIAATLVLTVLFIAAALATAVQASPSYLGGPSIPQLHRAALEAALDAAVRTKDKTLDGVTIDNVQETYDGTYYVVGWLFGRDNPSAERSWLFTSRLSRMCSEPIQDCWLVERIAIDAPIEPLVIYPVLHWDLPPGEVEP